MTDSKALQVYLLRLGDTNYFKVGMTADICGRLAGLQTATPFDLHVIMTAKHENAYTVERDMHEALKDYHVRNEWFQGEQDVIARIFTAVSAMAVIDKALDIPGSEILPADPDEAPAGKDQIIAFMLQQGYSYRQIERDLGVSHQTISQVSRLLRSKQMEAPIECDDGPLTTSATV